MDAVVCVIISYCLLSFVIICYLLLFVFGYWYLSLFASERSLVFCCLSWCECYALLDTYYALLVEVPRMNMQDVSASCEDLHCFHVQ